MASLFRPWAEDSTTTKTSYSPIKTPDKELVSTRDIQFQNVKEHFRKRMENKSKKLRMEVSRKVTSVEVPPPMIFSDKAYSDSIHAFWEDLSLSGCTDLLDTALVQGLPPGILEEYARMLTEQQRQATERSRKQRPKKFRCPHCHVGFSNNGQLKGHIRIHTGERPFKCDAEQCGKSFTRNEELTRHRRIHSGLRPFPCPECGKPFGRKDHLKKHVRTHFQQRYQLIPLYPSQFPPYYYGI